MDTRNRFADKISNEATASLPAIQFAGQIRSYDHAPVVDEACEELRRSPVIGFDTETRPSFRAGV
ncbi:MAG: 3'-5' exonuclease domain-containing protein 2, partial [Alistipes sp.]|nr:3'-5' exonuclease domain-containing protein 2 [Alistipes sp.]